MSKATIFAEYPEIPEVASETNTTSETSVSKKKLKKQFKKHAKLLKQLAELHEQQIAKEQRIIAEANVKKNSFLNKVGDATVKALPSILTAITTAIIGYFASKPRQGR